MKISIWLCIIPNFVTEIKEIELDHVTSQSPVI